jgi:hypothetical protein
VGLLGGAAWDMRKKEWLSKCQDKNSMLHIQSAGCSSWIGITKHTCALSCFKTALASLQLLVSISFLSFLIEHGRKYLQILIGGNSSKFVKRGKLNSYIFQLFSLNSLLNYSVNNVYYLEGKQAKPCSPIPDFLDQNFFFSIFIRHKTIENYYKGGPSLHSPSPNK